MTEVDKDLVDATEECVFLREGMTKASRSVFSAVAFVGLILPDVLFAGIVMAENLILGLLLALQVSTHSFRLQTLSRLLVILWNR